MSDDGLAGEPGGSQSSPPASGIAEGSASPRIERVNEPGPTHLLFLRFLERVQLRDLERTRCWIADEERRETERRRGVAARPAPPDWLLELGLNGHSPPVYVHAGHCWNAGKRSRGLTRDGALRALADGVKPCTQCRPEAELGILD
jgi:hypothetical protein